MAGRFWSETDVCALGRAFLKALQAISVSDLLVFGLQTIANRKYVLGVFGRVIGNQFISLYLLYLCGTVFLIASLRTTPYFRPQRETCRETYRLQPNSVSDIPFRRCRTKGNKGSFSSLGTIRTRMFQFPTSFDSTYLQRQIG